MADLQAAEPLLLTAFKQGRTGEKLLQPLLGTLFDNKYQLARVLGSGTFGLMFEAHERDGARRTVALNVLGPNQLISDKDKITDTLKAVRNASWMGHVNVVGTLETGWSEGLPYLVSEFVSGESVDEMVSRTGRIAPQAAAKLCLQLVQGLSAIHQQGVFHGDVRPKNVLVTREDGQPLVKISGFGLFPIRARPDDEELDGKVFGRRSQPVRPYLAPELAHEGRISAQTDVYGVGAVFYRLLTAQPPVSGQTYKEFIHNLLEGDIVRPSGKVREIPSAFDRVVMRALSKSPSNRYPSLDALQKAIAPLVSVKVRTLAPIDGEAPRRRWIWLLVALIVLGGGGVAAWMLLGKSPQPVVAPAPVAAPPKVQFGSIEVATTYRGASTWAIVRLDGKMVRSLAPVTVPQVSAGTHQLKISREGYQSLVRSVVVAPGKVAKVVVELTRSGKRKRR